MWKFKIIRSLESIPTWQKSLPKKTSSTFRNSNVDLEGKNYGSESLTAGDRIKPLSGLIEFDIHACRFGFGTLLDVEDMTPQSFEGRTLAKLVPRIFLIFYVCTILS